jgi:hypothetical protein
MLKALGPISKGAGATQARELELKTIVGSSRFQWGGVEAQAPGKRDARGKRSSEVSEQYTSISHRVAEPQNAVGERERERESVCVCVKNHGHPHSLSPELGREVEKRIQGPREKRQEIK